MLCFIASVNHFVMKPHSSGVYVFVTQKYAKQNVQWRQRRAKHNPEDLTKGREMSQKNIVVRLLLLFHDYAFLSQ